MGTRSGVWRRYWDRGWWVLVILGAGINVVVIVLGFAWAFRPPRMAIPTDARYVAAEGRRVYHLPECSHARKISLGGRVWLRSHAEARLLGLRPCHWCRPDLRDPDPPSERSRFPWSGDRGPESSSSR